MMTFVAILYLILVVQVSLGVAMIATASVACNRLINAPRRSVDIVLYVLGCSSLALGVWAVVMLAAVMAFQGSTTIVPLAYVAALFYAVPLLAGGWLQARVARSLLTPPPIEQQRKDEWRISLLRVIGWILTLMPLGMPLGIFAGLYFAIAAIFGGSMRVQQESLLLILAIAVRTQAPLAEEIDVLADSSRGRFRRRLRKLAERLRNGERLSDALDDLPELCRREPSPPSAWGKTSATWFRCFSRRHSGCGAVKRAGSRAAFPLRGWPFTCAACCAWSRGSSAS